MLNAIRRQTIVKPGGIIELTLPELPEGTVVEVIVLVENSDNLTQESTPLLTSLIGSAPGSFATPEEADQFIREQRDEWGY
jgi:hypothetical protein